MEKRTAVSFALVMTTLLWSSNAARADIRQLEENPSAQPQSELLLTNTTDVVGLYLEGYNFPVGSWVWAPGTGMIPVLFQPMTIVWANTANLPTGLAGITNSVPTSLQGVNAFPLWVTLWPQSNTVTVLQPWSDVTLTEFTVPGLVSLMAGLRSQPVPLVHYLRNQLHELGDAGRRRLHAILRAARDNACVADGRWLSGYLLE